MNKSSVAKIFIIILVILMISASLIMIWCLWVAGPQTVWKIMRYDDSSITDFTKFPSRKLNASTDPFHFEEQIDANLLETIRLSEVGNKSLEEFLQETDKENPIELRNGADAPCCAIGR